MSDLKIFTENIEPEALNQIYTWMEYIQHPSRTLQLMKALWLTNHRKKLLITSKTL